MQEAIFVGRERQKEVYKQFLARETPWVLIITGLGGIGKSTLLHRLNEYTRTEPTFSKTGVVTIDFANEELRNDPLKLLDVLTEVTASYCNLQQIDDEFKKVLQQNFDQLAQLRQERIATGVSESEDRILREIRHQMRELSTEAFYAQIKTLALDRLVIMLDTCEWLTEPEGIEVGQWALNELVPGVHNRIKQQGKQCSVIMVSRVQLKLDAINGRDQRRLALPMLERVDVDEYLHRMGMQDPNLCERVYEVTHGHALCVSIIGDFWRNREDQNQPFTIADLPEMQLQEFSEIALMRFTNERVLKQLKSPFKELTRFGVLLRSFDLPFLRTVFSELLPEPEALERFNQLIRYPYIESRGNYRYAFHELLREALAEDVQKEEPEAWKRYHKRAFDYLNAAASHSPDWYYHLLAYDEKRGLVEWQQAIQEARSSGKREYVGALLQAALDKALHLSPTTHAEVVYEQGRFNYYGIQWEEALKSYNEALVSFEQAEDYAGQAKALQAIGDVQRTLGKPDAALVSYRGSRVLFQKVGDKLGEARCCQSTGDIQRLHNELDAALQSYQECLALFREVGERPEEAKALEAVGDIQRLRNDLDAAQRSYEQALVLYQEEKDRLKRARLLKSMGDVQRLRQDQDAALESYRQALAIFGELKEPTEEANVRQAIVEMQQPQSENKMPQQNYESASPLLPAAVLQPATLSPLRSRSPSSSRILLIGLLVLFVIGSSGLIYYTVFRPAQLQPQTQATVLAQAQATAQAQVAAQAAATDQAENNIIATVVARNNSQSTAIAAGLQNIYNISTSGKPALNDPLNDNSRGNGWIEVTSTDGSGCQFTGGAYHVTIPNNNFFETCGASSTDFTNFAFSVQMKIVQGNCGGMLFRGVDVNNGKFYYWRVCQDGSYGLFLYTSNNASTTKTLLSSTTTLINYGLNQSNLLTVIAKGQTIYLYANKQEIDSVNDGTFGHGEIGLSAESFGLPTDVAYTNAEVWTL